MLRIVVDVNAPVYAAQGIREDLTMYLERFGDTTVQSITEAPQTHEEVVQLEMEQWRRLNAHYGGMQDAHYGAK